MCLRILVYIGYFSHCCGQISDKRQFKGRGEADAQSEDRAGTAWQQDYELTQYASAAREQEIM